ncbi:MAG TPA: hypothetical protein VEL74_02525 [Thermoanaerobaculia bacterium]|nr:hypothetical protein [Thermoanaerobaculia bacterium]
MASLYQRVAAHAIRLRLRSRGRNRARRTNLLIQEEVLAAGSSIATPLETIHIPRDTVLVFADDDPEANWAHPCRYLLYDAADGELYQQVPASFPPYLHQPVPNLQLLRSEFPRGVRWRPSRLPWQPPVLLVPGNRYAILFCGVANYRHVNDLEFLYRTLRQTYGYPTKHIRVLEGDGTLGYTPTPGLDPPPGDPWPGDVSAYQMKVDGPGTRAALASALNALRRRLKPNDSLLLHTVGHGYTSGDESFLVTHAGPPCAAGDLAERLAQLPPFACLTVMMSQSGAGGFCAPLLAASPARRTTFAAACGPLGSSYGYRDFGYFARDWTAAMRGADPYGAPLPIDADTNGDGRVVAKEAFVFANRVRYEEDSPRYEETPGSRGGCSLKPGWRPAWWDDLWKELLLPWWKRLPPEVFYGRLYDELIPAAGNLREIRDAGLEGWVTVHGRRLRQIVTEVMSRPVE